MGHSKYNIRMIVLYYYKEQHLLNSSEHINILSKEVLQLNRYYRGGAEGQELQWNC